MNVEYPNTVEPILKNGKVSNVLMAPMTVDERLDKFMEFLHAWDRREDELLAGNPQQFSHRLHWDEMPWVDEMSKEEDLRILIRDTLIWSFSNEHWQTFRAVRDGGLDAMEERIDTERHARSDLYQIFYPKGTNVKEWLLESPDEISRDLQEQCIPTLRPGVRHSIMSLAYTVEDLLKSRYRFRNCMYPLKNFARHIAMARPDLVDPETWVTPGTLSYYGVWQIFGGRNLFGKAKFDREGPLNKDAYTLLGQFARIMAHKDYPIERHHNVNVEDKCCFFAKHLFINHGVKKTTPPIPYDWVYPLEFNLKKSAIKHVHLRSAG
jgi:hypothetical protein